MNSSQQMAVSYLSGPLLIIAGAGTGKTTTIIEKVAHLIEKKKVPPSSILSLTFTEKAASEMEERLDQRLPYGYFQLNIATFHAFADQILRSESTHIGISSLYRLLNEAETIMFLRENLFLFKLRYFRPLGNPNKFLGALLQHFSRLRDEDCTPEQYLSWAKKMNRKKSIDAEERAKNLELATAFQTYQTLKLKENVFDYADLISYALELFRKRPQILKRYRDQYKYVLVDEFQDTNIAQYSIIKLLCPSSLRSSGQAPNLTLVGDDSQAIYKFRGASVSNILTFKKDYKGAKQITLKTNYRSTQIILDRAYKLIKNNNPNTLESKLGISKELISVQTSKGMDIVPILTDRGEDEADLTAKEILNLNKKYKFSDIAILVRANNHADSFTRALTRKGIPYQFLGPGALFKQPEVKDLIAYLNVLANLDDSVSLYRVIEMEIFEIDSKDVSLLLTFSKRTNLSLFQAIEIVCGFEKPELYQPEHNRYKPHCPQITKNTKQKLLTIYTLITKHLNLVKKDTAGQILYYFLNDSGYLQKITKYKTEKEERVALNVSRFFDKLKSYEITHEDANVYALVDFIKMSMELGESPNAIDLEKDTYDAVKILTVHSAKGLEFPVVFMVNLTQDRFPTRERKEIIPIPTDLIKELLPTGDFHQQEERRLFYVGMTRAKERLYFTASRYYGEGKRVRKFSPFIYESLDEKQLTSILETKKLEKEQLSIFDFKKKLKTTEPKKITGTTSLSFTQIDTYQLCPLKYKYQYVLKIPTIPVGQASLGTTVHNTLEQFYTEYMNNKNIKKERLIELFEESWIPVGFTSKSDEITSKREGRKMLINYFNTFHSKTLKILDLEKSFRIKIGSGEDVFINGKIDRLDSTSQKNIEIIDYKTGNLQEEKKLKNSLQLSIYLLAATDKGLYNKKLSEVSLTFYYLQANKKITVDQTEETLRRAKENILDAVENIKAERFRPKVGPWCNFCQFKMICEAWQ